MSSEAKQILVADDEQGLRDLLKFALSPLGYCVTAVADGAAAVEAFRQQAFDLCVLDVHMPRMTGLDALKEIRALNPSQSVIIITSGAGNDQAFQNQMAEQDVMTLLKPVSLKELRSAIARALERPSSVPPHS